MDTMDTMQHHDKRQKTSKPFKYMTGKQSGAPRRKTGRACLFCRRSHMTCEEARPCQRCVKRGVAELCGADEDGNISALALQEEAANRGAASKRRSSTDIAFQSNGSHDSNGTVNVSVSPASVNEQMLIGSAAVSTVNGNPSILHSGNGSVLDSMPFAFDINDPSLEGFNMVQRGPFTTSRAGSPRFGSYFDSVSDSIDLVMQAASTQFNAGFSPEHLAMMDQFALANGLQNAPPSSNGNVKQINQNDLGTISPHNYTYGYARLKRWLTSHCSETTLQKTMACTDIYRGHLFKILQNMSDVELINNEKSFLSILEESSTSLESMPVPACLWRRTGEVSVANRKMCKLIGIPPHMFRQGRLCFYQFLSESSIVEYFQTFAQQAKPTDNNAGSDDNYTSLMSALRTLPSRLAHKVSLDDVPGTTTAEDILTHLSRESPSPPPTEADNSRRPLTDAEICAVICSDQARWTKCAMSYSIRRDEHRMPLAIIATFTPLAVYAR